MFLSIKNMSYLEFLKPGPQHTAENMWIALRHQQSPAALTTVQLLLWFRYRPQTTGFTAWSLTHHQLYDGMKMMLLLVLFDDCRVKLLDIYGGDSHDGLKIVDVGRFNLGSKGKVQFVTVEIMMGLGIVIMLSYLVAPFICLFVYLLSREFTCSRADRCRTVSPRGS